MNTPPPLTNLDPRELSVVIASRWGLPPLHVTYQAVGFGSHHWRADAGDGSGRRWFVTADEGGGIAGSAAMLRRALGAAAALRDPAGGGIAQVVAPLPDRSGELVATLDDGRWAVALYPWLDVEPSAFGAFASETDRSAAQCLIARVHAATARIPEHLPDRDDFRIPLRDELEDALNGLGVPWSGGPYTGQTQSLLREAQDSIWRALADYDRLGERVRADPGDYPWVLTHGEPHAGNIVRRRDGGLAIVDWDTCAMAPRERDLWQMLSPAADPDADLVAYQEEAGDIPVSTDALALYRLRWDLSEVAIYVQWFRSPHEATEDMRTGFGGLRESLGNLIARSPR